MHCSDLRFRLASRPYPLSRPCRIYRGCNGRRNWQEHRGFTIGTQLEPDVSIGNCPKGIERGGLLTASTGPQCLVGRSGALVRPVPYLARRGRARLPEAKCRISDNPWSTPELSASHKPSRRCLHCGSNRPYGSLTQAASGAKCKGPDYAVGYAVGPDPRSCCGPSGHETEVDARPRGARAACVAAWPRVLGRRGQAVPGSPP